MKGTLKRLIRILAVQSVKILSLLLAVSILSFALVSASPVDPVQQYILGLGTAVSPQQRAQIEDYWGVNEPPVQRYLGWLKEVLRGNLGESSVYRRPVADMIGERFLGSLALMLCAWVFAGVIGFGLGWDVPGKVAGQTVKKGVLYLKLRAHILAGAGLSSGIFRVAWMVPRGVFVACGGTQGKRDHRAEALPSDFAGLYLKSDVFCRHCPPHPAKAG